MRNIDRRFRTARIWSNGELRRISGLFRGQVVNVSAGENLDKEGASYDSYFTNAAAFSITNFAPGSYRGFQGQAGETLLDLRKQIPADMVSRFDVVLNHTTLEHVFDVSQAFTNLCRMSRDIVIVVVPFTQVQHENEGYQDFWRFTPTCLRRLFEVNGLEVIYEAASPDRDAAVYLFFVGSRHSSRWRDKMPAYNKLREVGSWIGAPKPNWRERLAGFFWRVREMLRRRSV